MVGYNRELLADILSWDIHNWAVALPFWDSAIAHLQPGASALEIGSREGGLSLYLALKGFRVICSDLENPETVAQLRHRKYTVQFPINYVEADAVSLPMANESFDVVTFKSILGTIGRDNHPERQEQTIHEIHRVLRPGGTLLFAENLAGTALHRYFRKMTRWGGYWRYVTIDEMRHFHRLFSLYSYDSFGFFGAFGRTEFQRQLIHHIDKLIDPILKDKHKYIIVGHARK